MAHALYCTDEHLDRSFAEEVTADVESLFTCMQCGSCTASCPTASRMSLSPQRISRLIRLGLREEVLASRDFWLCTSCNACTAHCPRGISMLEAMTGLKAYAIRHGCEVPEDLRLLRRTIHTLRNISGDPMEERLLWSRNLPQSLASVAPRKGADVLYFAGCVASFYPRAFSIPQAFGRTLEHAGVSFTTMGVEEWCCGYPLFNSGLANEVGELIEHNLAQVKALGASVLVATCPSCYYTWKKIYPRYAAVPANLTIMHASQFLAELLDAGRIRPAELSRVVTYHDPCDLGRKSGEVEAPRRILAALPGIELREMANTRENTLCCGGGGDVKIFSHDAEMDTARRRLRQALDIKAETIVSACQQCKRALIGAAQLARQPMKVLDLTEIVWETLHAKVRW
jgi:heterodisulfide reductase subunit D